MENIFVTLFRNGIITGVAAADQTADQTVGHDILQMGNKEEEGRSMHLRIFEVDWYYLDFGFVENLIYKQDWGQSRKL